MTDETTCLLMEIRENRDRESFSLRDQVNAARVLAPIIREATKKRQVENLNKSDSPVPCDSHGTGEISVQAGEELRVVLAREVGTGEQRLYRAMKIVEASTSGDDYELRGRLAAIVSDMFEDENVNAAWAAYQSLVKPEPEPEPEEVHETNTPVAESKPTKTESMSYESEASPAISESAAVVDNPVASALETNDEALQTARTSPSLTSVPLGILSVKKLLCLNNA